MMKKYLEVNIGKKIKKSIVTGESFFTKVYQRDYEIEVLAVVGDEVFVEVSSYDKVPSGFKAGGTDRNYGEFKAKIGKRTKGEIISELINKADHPFLMEYNIKF